MIQKIAGENFQSYKKFEMVFSPGVNVIIGETDAGKSAAFRLVEWVITNRPLGDAYRAEWGGTTKGQIWTTDDQTVLRVKGNKENFYQVNDEQKMKAFGQNPPEEINQVLMLDEINMQPQEAPPFLLDNSAGEVARILNQAASLQMIDTATMNLTRGHRHALKEIESAKSTLQDQQKELQQYENLPGIEKRIIELEHLTRQLNTTASQRNMLGNLFKNIIHTNSQLKKTVNVRAITTLLNGIEKKNEKWKKLKGEFLRLNELQKDLEKTQKAIVDADAEIVTGQQEYDKLMPNICPICERPM